MSGRALAERIDALLPQTQCGKCGYSACLPYARAIAAGEAQINQCPPGGAATIAGLAALLGLEHTPPLNPAHGREHTRAVALIDEARCIGCTLCIQACPVDAIVGAAKLMHTVIAEVCTGCELCLPPCPVDCIDMVPLAQAQAPWTLDMADAARARFQLRRLRHARDQAERAQHPQRNARQEPGGPRPDTKQAVIRAALERARARTAGAKPGNKDSLSPQIAAAEVRRAAGKKP